MQAAGIVMLAGHAAFEVGDEAGIGHRSISSSKCGAESATCSEFGS
jgi:hypothetical protein